MEEFKTSPLTQDLKVAYYYLENHRVKEAERMFLRMRTAAHGVATENRGEEADKWKGVYELLKNIVDDIKDLQRNGRSRKEISEVIIDRYGGGMSVKEIEEMGQASDLDWKATADSLSREKQLLEQELQETEEEFMEIYRKHKEE